MQESIIVLVAQRVKKRIFFFFHLWRKLHHGMNKIRIGQGSLTQKNLCELLQTPWMPHYFWLQCDICFTAAKNLELLSLTDHLELLSLCNIRIKEERCIQGSLQTQFSSYFWKRLHLLKCTIWFQVTPVNHILHF